MKRLTILATMLCLAAAPAFGSLNITGDANEGNDFFKPLLEMFATGANSGLATATAPGATFSVGLQLNMTVNPKDGILANPTNADNYSFPLLYANLKLGDFILFARGLVVDQEGASFTIYGGGLGWIFIEGGALFPQIRLVAAYHVLEAKDVFLKVEAASVGAVADWKLPLPLLEVHALGHIGYERNTLTTSWDAALVGAANKTIGLDQIRAALGVEVRLFDLLAASYEFTIKPSVNHNLSLSVRL